MTALLVKISQIIMMLNIVSIHNIALTTYIPYTEFNETKMHLSFMVSTVKFSG